MDTRCAIRGTTLTSDDRQLRSCNTGSRAVCGGTTMPERSYISRPIKSKWRVAGNTANTIQRDSVPKFLSYRFATHMRDSGEFALMLLTQLLLGFVTAYRRSFPIRKHRYFIPVWRDIAR